MLLLLTSIQVIRKTHSQVGVCMRCDSHPRLAIDIPLLLIAVSVITAVYDLHVHALAVPFCDVCPEEPTPRISIKLTKREAECAADCSRLLLHHAVCLQDSRYHDQGVLHRVVPYTPLCRAMRGLQVELDGLHRLY